MDLMSMQLRLKLPTSGKRSIRMRHDSFWRTLLKGLQLSVMT
jgi:hypothetical protein